MGLYFIIRFSHSSLPPTFCCVKKIAVFLLVFAYCVGSPLPLPPPSPILFELVKLTLYIFLLYRIYYHLYGSAVPVDKRQ